MFRRAPSLVGSRRRALALVMATILALVPMRSPGADGLASANAAGPPGVEQLDDIVILGEFTVAGQSLDHVVMAWDEIIDPRFIPDPSDFTITIDGVDHAGAGVDLLFAGAASPTFGFGDDGLSFMRLDLPAGVALDVDDTFLLAYEPGAIPVRDLALNPAPGFSGVQGLAFDVGSFNPVVAIVDSYHGADKVVMVLTDPIEPGSLPSADQFEVTVDGSGAEVLTVADLHPEIGMAFIELTLDAPVAHPDAIVTVGYTSQPGTLVSRYRGETLPDQVLDATVIIATNAASATLTSGESLSTSTGDGPTPGDPVQTTVTAAGDGAVSISEGSVDYPEPVGYGFFGHQVVIEMADAPSPETPNVLQFAIDGAVVPAGHDHTTIGIYRDGVLVPDCTGAAGVAEPSPCVAGRVALADGDIALTVLTVSASTWNFGVVMPYEFGGFLAPVDGDTPNVVRAGRAIPVRFSLGGDRGLEILAAGSPLSRTISCDGLTEGDAVEETLTAGASSLSYDAATDTYTYVWKTSADWTDTCRRLRIDFADGSSAVAIFDFRR